jgi:hypothetical protein
MCVLLLSFLGGKPQIRSPDWMTMVCGGGGGGSFLDLDAVCRVLWYVGGDGGAALSCTESSAEISSHACSL